MALMYDDYVRTLAARAEQAFSEIKGVYGFDYGDEFEIAVCKLLRRALPDKYGVCRGFVVDQRGKKAGDDVIIFDRHVFPQLRALGDENYTQKEHVPIEAVYAYVECKHTLVLDAPEDNDSGLFHASEQVAAVKAICATRAARGFGAIDTYVDMRHLAPLMRREFLPTIRNPPFGMVFGRRVAAKRSGEIVTDQRGIHELLLQSSDIKKSRYPVDVVIAGPSNLMVPGYIRSDGTRNNALFMLSEGVEASHACVITPGFSAGVAICHLLAVLDWMRLGRMPWEDILNEATRAEHPGAV